MAADAYRGVVIKTMRRQRGPKASYRILEDNDPQGYKSELGIKAKKDCKIKAIPYPRYSPDLNPLDFFVWAEVGRRMRLQKAPRKESAEQYKARLRRTALAIPASVIRKAVHNIRLRARQVVDADGGDIPRD